MGPWQGDCCVPRVLLDLVLSGDLLQPLQPCSFPSSAPPARPQPPSPSSRHPSHLLPTPPPFPSRSSSRAATRLQSSSRAATRLQSSSRAATLLQSSSKTVLEKRREKSKWECNLYYLGNHQVPCVPVIYGLKNSLFIEQPSVQQRKFAQLDEEKCIHMEKSEFKKLLKASSEGKISVDGNAPGVAEKSKFKRNRAKGPNPLSCKKKKPKTQPSAAQNQGPKADGEAKRKRVRKCKRSGKDSNQAETAS